MSSVLEKSLAIVELLVDHPMGLPVTTIAQVIEQPASGVHRLLRELARLGYVRQVQAQGDYRLTIKLPAMGLGFLGRAGITDVAQPVLDRLEEEHQVIHDVLEEFDRALVRLVTEDGTGRGGEAVLDGVQESLDLLTDTLLSHLAYEERELIGPLSRHGLS